MTDLTPEEEKSITDYIKRMIAFGSGANRNCPNCGEPITGVKLYEKVEPETYSLYVLVKAHNVIARLVQQYQDKLMDARAESRNTMLAESQQQAKDDGAPIANKSLKDEYAAYCAQERARHYSPVSYELWLEGTLNACRLDLANAQKAIHAPDVYRAALEQVDTLLEAGSPKEPSETLYVAQSNLYVLRLHVAEARKLILEALGGVDEVTVFINGTEKTVPVELSFEDIIVLAFDEGARELTPTVLYSRAFGGRSGVLIKGNSVRVTDGTRISVAFTGNA